MAPFASGPAPRWEPGSARTQFIDSEPPDGIEFGAELRQQQPSCVRRPSCGQPPSSSPAALLRGGLLLRRRPCGRPSSAAAFLRPTRPSCGRSSSPRPSSVRPCVRPSSSAAAFLRPPARIASASARGCSVVGVSSLLTCRNSFCVSLVAVARFEPRPGRRSCVGCRLPRAPMPHMPGSATNQPGAHQRHRVRRICDSASDVDARSTVLHLDWSAVNGPSFCCTCALHRFCESDARTPNPLFLVSPMAVNKKQPFRRKFDEKSSHACEMRCIDVTQNRRDIAVAAVCSARCESLRRACRSARTTDSRGRCSSRSGGSACCRCAVR